MTTDVAFKLMLHTRGIYKKLRLTPGTVARMRHNLGTGKRICQDTKFKYLERAGFIKVQDARWIVLKDGVAKKISQIDYLKDLPFLTLLGRINGFNDDDIKRINKSIIEDPEKFRHVYKQML